MNYCRITGSRLAICNRRTLTCNQRNQRNQAAGARFGDPQTATGTQEKRIHGAATPKKREGARKGYGLEWFVTLVPTSDAVY